MALIGTLTSGVSALKTFSKGLEVIGNNIANVNTTGYKSDSVSFADTFSNTLRAASAASGDTSVQIGTGVQVAGISTNFTQGSLSSTGNKTDLGVSGSGYFVVQNPNGVNYATRDGSFHFNDSGDLVNSQGFNVLDSAGAKINVANYSTVSSVSIGSDGSVTAFMSDAKNRWSAPWVRWESFGTFWPQMVRDVSHRDRTVRAGIRPGSRDGEAIVYYDVLADPGDASGDSLSTAAAPHILVEVAGQAPRTISLEETAPGHFEARIAGDQGGLYRIVSGSSELLLPEAGFFRESQETKPQAVNTALLGEISRITGGRMRPSIEQLLNDKGGLVREKISLWPYFIILALVLNFLEVGLRKGFFERLIAWGRSRSLPGLGRQAA